VPGAEWKLFGPAALCRLDDEVLRDLQSGRGARVLLSSLVTLVAGSALFGAAFGFWRSGGQALLSAVKMPLLMLAVTGFSAVVNTLMAQALGARLSFLQTLRSMLLAFAIASAFLAACAPVTAFFAWQAAAPGTPGDLTAYRALLVMNTVVVGVAGVIGNVGLLRVLETLTGARRLAGRVLLAWILVGGLAGCELSWVISPFLARPDLPVPVMNPNAFRRNFFEYLFNTAAGRIEGRDAPEPGTERRAP
jgi:hypothetical protein